MKWVFWVVLSFCGGIVGSLVAPKFGINAAAGFFGLLAIVAFLRVIVAPDSFVPDGLAVMRTKSQRWSCIGWPIATAASIYEASIFLAVFSAFCAGVSIQRWLAEHKHELRMFMVGDINELEG